MVLFRFCSEVLDDELHSDVIHYSKITSPFDPTLAKCSSAAPKEMMTFDSTGKSSLNCDPVVHIFLSRANLCL